MVSQQQQQQEQDDESEPMSQELTGASHHTGPGNPGTMGFSDLLQQHVAQSLGPVADGEGASWCQVVEMSTPDRIPFRLCLLDVCAVHPATKSVVIVVAVPPLPSH